MNNKAGLADMAVLFTRTPDGGFLAGDTVTGLTAYAFPTSTHATAAKRHPETVANTMLAAESAALRNRETAFGRFIAAQDAERLHRLAQS